MTEPRTALDHVRIVLVQTWHPGNIGAAARAMRTMGLTQLVLVSPRQFPDEEATRMAAGGEPLLEQARVVESLEEAVADCGAVVGLSARLRNLALPQFEEGDEMARELMSLAEDMPVALVFGRERSGLTNDEIACCTHQLSLPANPDYPILNLSQAVQVCAHELYRAWRHRHADQKSRTAPADIGMQSVREKDLPPTREQMQHFQQSLATALQEAGFLNQPHAQTLERLQNFYQRSSPTRKELSLLQGALRALTRPSDDT
ncbi:RNA methyltransferase [Kushneria marisflavi]|uniref:tRNA (cytidine/uridine-2'-O-)-methyltransferase TrmJ n=1 Tax=Kushneria marisflavi TaxID=157779 RepID=A0A240UMV1_9GAMM|nr:RNA methyltransferase [Kushneria marisflavi]ART62403.1 RNA methyltransferase [Kushneria marisflavi]RKD87513.1 tRNA (cytidine32/uridine32-2'-O)-methyltransferase [Kushneria marisflavi]